MPGLAAHSATAGLLHLAAGIALLAIAVAGGPGVPRLPVRLTLPGVELAAAFAQVNPVAALAVVALLSAAVRLAAALPPLRAITSSRLLAGRHGLRWVELSQTAGITVVIVGMLNGIAEAGAIVLLYASSAGAVLLLWVQDRSPEAGARNLWPFSIGAAIGIVPWGVIALYQVAALVVGPAPSPVVRVVTVVLLVVAALHWLTAWLHHERRGVWADAVVADRTHVALTVLASAIFVILALVVTAMATVLAV
jgi:hypothetical protein